MKIVLEESVPYDRSILWALHEAYFTARGTDAWLGGDIPYKSTSNYAAARQHARMLEALVVDLEDSGRLAADAPVYVLEIGSGLGEFAQNFLRALEPALAARVRYLLSDFAASTVASAVESDDLAERVARGQVVPARFDMRTPAELTGLDGAPLDVPIAAVIANYVACVAPTKIVRKDGDKYFEAWCSVSGLEPLEDLMLRIGRPGVLRGLEIAYQWREMTLDAIVADRFHQDVLARIAAPFPQAVIRYPWVWFDTMRTLRERMVPGGMMVVSDYGASDGAVLKSTEFKGPDMFGNSLAHGLDFSVFEPFCAIAGVSMGRTQGPLRSVHTAVLRFGAMSAAFAEAFARHEQASSDSDALLDLMAAARHYASAANGKEPNYFRAVRLFQRCLDLDPYSAALHHEMADACIEAGLFELGHGHLVRCAELDDRSVFDVDFDLGRMYARTGRARQALTHYLRSLARDAHPVTFANIGLAHMELGEYDAGESALARSLELAPDNERSQKLMEQLQAARAGTPPGPPPSSPPRSPAPTTE